MAEKRRARQGTERIVPDDLRSEQEPPPRAVRPIGMLGAAGFALDYGAPAKVESVPAPSLGRVVDDGETPEDELPPTLPPKPRPPRTQRMTTEAEKLETWLRLTLQDADPFTRPTLTLPRDGAAIAPPNILVEGNFDPPPATALLTGDVPAPRQSDLLEAWLRSLGPLSAWR